MKALREHLFILSYLFMLAIVIGMGVVRHYDLNRICLSQKQTVASVTHAFEEFRKTVLLSYEQFPPDEQRRERDAAFFNAVLGVLKAPDC